jgi:hypothetical protein
VYRTIDGIVETSNQQGRRLGLCCLKMQDGANDGLRDEVRSEVESRSPDAIIAG